MVKKICVFCASSSKVKEIYFEAARKLAGEFLSHNITLLYGGGSVGLMGEISNTMLKKQGKVIGVIPEFMLKREWGNKKVTKLVVVSSMQERKQKLIEIADAVVALPGGCGTVDELMEVITLKQMGLFTRPVIIVNINEFYNPLIDLLNKMIDEKFMGKIHGRIWTVVNSTHEVVQAIKTAPGWNKNYIKFAEV